MQEKIPQTMQAVLLTGNGGFEKLVYRSDVPVPVPGPNEVLIQVGAAGINNIDINTLIGCTCQEDVIFENLIRYIEHGVIKPVVAKSYPLSEIVRAQKDLLAKDFVGKLVLIPPLG